MNKINKIVELIIDIDDSENEDLGIEVVSLVKEAAMEVDFQYFNNIECNSECDSNIYELSEEAQNAILEFAENNGENINEDDIFINFEGYSFEDVAGEVGKSGLLKSIIGTIRNKLKSTNKTKILENEPQIYYRYTGPTAQRKFCKAMLNLTGQGRIYSEDQINKMNNLNKQFAPKGQSSYSIFKYNGGVNCLHYWQKLSIFKNKDGQKIILTADPANSDESLASKSQNIKRPSPYGAIENNAKLNFSIDNEKKIVIGALAIPNKFIKRIDEFGNLYYVYFSEATIQKMAQKFLKLNKHNKTDIEHDGNILTDNILLESWIKEDLVHDKSLKYGFSDVPIGTWFVAYKLSDKTWDLVKKEKVKGFSLAGGFIEKLTNKNDENLLNKIKNILNDVKY